MRDTELKKITLETVELVKVVAAFIREQLGRVTADDISDKGVNSLVSYVDRESEKRLVEGLRQITPSAVFLTEENTVAPESGSLKWIIDPLDGTTNFLHRVPIFAISAGLEYEGKMVVGVVCELMREEYFYAWKGGGAFLNGEKLAVSKTSRPFDACICIGLPAVEGPLYRHTLHLLSSFLPTTRGVRNLGAAAVEMAYVACGRFDAFIELGLAPWDVSAGCLLIEEAGGRVSDIEGKDDYIYGKSILASNGRLHESLREAAVLPSDC